MASVLYDKGREGILEATVHLIGDVRVMLVKSAYVFDPAHMYLADITAENDNGRTASLTTKTYTSGVFDAADTALSATDAVACNALVLYQHTGGDNNARLIAYIDSAMGLPFTPAAGQGVLITFDNTANRIFKL